jgi:hypothetical protein
VSEVTSLKVRHDPARDDLAFAKKLAMDNPDLSAELEVLQKEICDRRGSLMVLSARRLIPCLSGFYPHPQDVGCFQAPEVN